MAGGVIQQLLRRELQSRATVRIVLSLHIEFLQYGDFRFYGSWFLQNYIVYSMIDKKSKNDEKENAIK